MGPPRPGSRRCALFCGRFLPRVCTVSYGEENSPLTSADLYLSLTHISLSRAETRCTTSARAHTHTTHCTETLGLESAAGAHMPAHALTYNRSWLYSAVHTLEPCSARSEPHLVLRHALPLELRDGKREWAAGVRAPGARLEWRVRGLAWARVPPVRWRGGRQRRWRGGSERRQEDGIVRPQERPARRRRARAAVRGGGRVGGGGGSGGAPAREQSAAGRRSEDDVGALGDREEVEGRVVRDLRARRTRASRLAAAALLGGGGVCGAPTRRARATPGCSRSPCPHRRARPRPSRGRRLA